MKKTEINSPRDMITFLWSKNERANKQIRKLIHHTDEVRKMGFELFDENTKKYYRRLVVDMICSIEKAKQEILKIKGELDGGK